MFNGELYRLWKRANANPGMSVDIGNIVVCDSCSEDYTDSDAEGGMLFDTKAICPACIQRWRDGAEEFGELAHIRAEASPGEKFREFVLRMRGGDNTITVRTVR